MPRTRCDPRDLLIALNAEPELSRAAICKLAAELPRWLEARSVEATGTEGLPRATLERALVTRRRAATVARGELAAARESGARVVTRLDDDYPPALLDLPLPPPVLFVAGELRPRPAVAIVGSRRATPYGIEVARWFGRHLAEAGALVISGLALGIDGAAHRGALAAEGGDTAAILGCGLDVGYPRAHARLSCEIRARGRWSPSSPAARRPSPGAFRSATASSPRSRAWWSSSKRRRAPDR